MSLHRFAAIAALMFVFLCWSFPSTLLAGEVPGDTDGNGCVNFNDFQTLVVNYNTAVAGGSAVGDFDGNGFVNFDDFQTLFLWYGFGC
ncbi:MAG: hypothetical protein L0228_02385 [Planctomycetes bacterium]|nr:hypothetical protein [Planctomycetota bacterium]